MRRIRSTTDEMLAARHDPMPWRSRGSRWATQGERSDGSANGARVFDPRVECIPSRDPHPWFRQGARGDAPLRYSVRPEYARPEPNPILVAFRGRLKYQHAAGVTTSAAGLASIWIRDLRFYAGADATPAQIEDARKVLTRLVGVFG